MAPYKERGSVVFVISLILSICISCGNPLAHCSTVRSTSVGKQTIKKKEVDSRMTVRVHEPHCLISGTKLGNNRALCDSLPLKFHRLFFPPRPLSSFAFSFQLSRSVVTITTLRYLCSSRVVARHEPSEKGSDHEAKISLITENRIILL